MKEEEFEESFEDNGCWYESFVSENGYTYYPVTDAPKWIHKKIDNIEKKYGYDVPSEEKFYFKGKNYRYAVSYEPHPKGTMTWFYWKRKRGKKK